MNRILALLLFGALLLPLPLSAAAKDTRDAVLSDRSGYRGAPPVKKVANDLSIEVCTDTCDLYLARKVKSESEVWDTVFLHQAYFDAAEAAKAFRAKYAALLSKVMAAYASKCSKFPQDAARASCIIKHLAGRNDIAYKSVHYDGGARCEVTGSLVKVADKPDKPDKTKCTKR